MRKDGNSRKKRNENSLSKEVVKDTFNESVEEICQWECQDAENVPCEESTSKEMTWFTSHNVKMEGKKAKPKLVTTVTKSMKNLANASGRKCKL